MENKKSRELLIMTLISLLILVAVAFIYIITSNIEKNISKKVYIHQIYSSDYDLHFLDDNYIYGTYNNYLNVIINTNGEEIYRTSEELTINDSYKLKDNNYLLYNITNNTLNTYLFDGKDLKNYYSIKDVSKVEPLLSKDNYLIALTEIKDNDLYIYKLDNSGITVLKNTTLKSNILSNDNRLIIKKDDYYGVVDLDGNIIIDNIYQDITIDSNNNYILKDKKKLYSLISEDKVLLKSNYNYIYEEYNYYLVVNKKNKLALYDKDINKIIDYKLNYNNTNSLKLYKTNNTYLIVNNYNSNLELKYNNIYVIKDNKLINTINNLLLKQDDYLYTYNNKEITFYDENFNILNTLSLENDNITKITKLNNTTKEITYLKEEKEIKESYNNDNELIELDLGTKIESNTNYYIFKKDNTLNIYDLNGTLLDSITGTKIELNNKIIIVDKAIYDIKER